jgi:hypothetical protein
MRRREFILLACGEAGSTGLDVSRLDQSWIGAGAETFGARAFQFAAQVESANSIRAEVIGSIDM